MSRNKYRVSVGGVPAWVKGRLWDVGGMPAGASLELTAAQAARVKRLAERIGAVYVTMPCGARPSARKSAPRGGKLTKAAFLKRMAAGRAKAARARNKR